MKFSAIIAVSTLAFTTVSALPLEMVYRSASSYYQARDVLPSGHAYPRAAAPEATPTPSPEVPPVNPALTRDSPDTVGDDDPYNNKRSSSKQRRDAIRTRSAAIYEREPEPEPVPEPEPEASPEAKAELVDDDDFLLDEASRAALLRRLIAAEEEAAEKKADEYIRSFRFHRREVDYAS
ncbi:hypothetical protein BGX38DRAFT_1142907 [Terfezia claveryi]|nr:hypothetical protein BGX38DRAFT_1142907 [Terfezia claveryi]